MLLCNTSSKFNLNGQTFCNASEKFNKLTKAFLVYYRKLYRIPRMLVSERMSLLVLDKCIILPEFANENHPNGRCFIKVY